jgi:ubiquinone/menaquinone biosynthesis C-methylase UbiE
MNIEAFTGRAQAYTSSRPGYPDEAIEYIRKLVPPNAVFADIGAGTGKLTTLLAKFGNEIFAVEPNANMREQLTINLASFSNIKIINGTAEATTLPNNSVDVITNAQALNRFDLDAFRAECLRVGKPNFIVISIYNDDEANNSSRYKKSTGVFYRNPAVREFPNPVFFTRDKWLLYHASMEGVPQEFDSVYEEYTAELNDIFNRDNVDGILRLALITNVYSERIK